MTKIHLETFKKWISEKIKCLLGVEDEILSGMIFNELEKEQCPDPRSLYIQLVPFLEKKVRKFMIELWLLLVNAQENGIGVPKKIIEELKTNKKGSTENNNYGQALKKQFNDN